MDKLFNYGHVGSSRTTLNNRRGPKILSTPTRTDSTIRHSTGDVTSHADHISSEHPLSATRSSPLEDTSGEDLGRLTPSSSQWSNGTATVSLSHQESISLSDMMHPSHDMPSSQRSPDEVYAEASRTSAESNLTLWNILEISQQAYDELWVASLML